MRTSDNDEPIAVDTISRRLRASKILVKIHTTYSSYSSSTQRLLKKVVLSKNTS